MEVRIDDVLKNKDVVHAKDTIKALKEQKEKLYSSAKDLLEIMPETALYGDIDTTDRFAGYHLEHEESINEIEDSYKHETYNAITKVHDFMHNLEVFNQAKRLGLLVCLCSSALILGFTSSQTLATLAQFCILILIIPFAFSCCNNAPLFIFVKKIISSNKKYTNTSTTYLFYDICDELESINQEMERQYELLRLKGVAKKRKEAGDKTLDFAYCCGSSHYILKNQDDIGIHHDFAIMYIDPHNFREEDTGKKENENSKVLPESEK